MSKTERARASKTAWQYQDYRLHPDKYRDSARRFYKKHQAQILISRTETKKEMRERNRRYNERKQFEILMDNSLCVKCVNLERQLQRTVLCKQFGIMPPQTECPKFYSKQQADEVVEMLGVTLDMDRIRRELGDSFINEEANIKGR
mgnify:FL=1